jgi:hypothetical protein
MKSLFPAALMRGVSVSALVITLAACTANPQPLDRPGDVPQTFTAPMDKTAPVWPMANWWTLYGTDELAPLQETAQRENLDIAMAGARVLQAEANDGVALSALFPTINAEIGGTRAGGNSSVPRATNRFNAGLTASYQQSFFGGEYHNLRAARENLRAQRYAAAVTGISVSAAVADQYFTILSLRERIAINKENVAAARRSRNRACRAWSRWNAKPVTRWRSCSAVRRKITTSRRRISTASSCRRCSRACRPNCCCAIRQWRRRKPRSMPPMPMSMRPARPSSPRWG